MTLCDRGHDVTLYEKSDVLGGNVIGAAVPPFKVDMKDYLDWLRRQPAKYPAKVLMNTEATKELLDKENYDAIVIACGSTPIVPRRIPGIDLPHVSWAPDAEQGNGFVGDNIVIIGSGAVGLEAAIEFADMGKKITVIDMDTAESAVGKLFAGSSTAAQEFLNRLQEQKVPIHYETKLKEITPDKVVAENVATGETVEFPCDTVLLAMGMLPRKDKVDELRHCAPETNVYIVGDCAKVATISEAVNDAFRVCLHI